MDPGSETSNPHSTKRSVPCACSPKNDRQAGPLVVSP